MSGAAARTGRGKKQRKKGINKKEKRWLGRIQTKKRGTWKSTEIEKSPVLS